MVALERGRLSDEPELAWLYTVAGRWLLRSRRQRVETEPLDVAHPPAAEEQYGPRVVEAMVSALEWRDLTLGLTAFSARACPNDLCVTR